MEKVLNMESLVESEKSDVNQLKNELEVVNAKYTANIELIHNYNKFVKDMNGVVKILVKGSSKAIDATKDQELLNTHQNECYTTMLEHKAMLLKVERKILLKRQAGFKLPPSKAHPAIKIGYSEDEHTTTDEHATKGNGKRVTMCL